MSKEMIFFQKFFGIIKKKYEKKDIRLVNFEKASKKRIAPKIRLEFIDGQKIRIEHGTVGFTKMWEYLGGEKNDIFLKQKKK